MKYWVRHKFPSNKKSHTNGVLNLMYCKGRHVKQRKRKNNDQGIRWLCMAFDLSREVQKNMGLHDPYGHKYVIRRGTTSLEEIKSRAFLRDWLDGEKNQTIKQFNKQTHSEIILFHRSMEHINVKPIPDTTGRFTSTSHQSCRITESVQKIPLVIQRKVKKTQTNQLQGRESWNCKMLNE